MRLLAIVDSSRILDITCNGCQTCQCGVPGFTLDPIWGTFGIQIMVALTTDIAETESVEEQEAPRWERAECTCPDWCERDHEQD